MYELIRVRESGWLLPRHRLAFNTRPVGNIEVVEDRPPDLNRHTLVAHMTDPVTGGWLKDVPPLYDAKLIKWSKGVVVFTGFERIVDEKGLKTLDVAQTWMLYEIDSAVC